MKKEKEDEIATSIANGLNSCLSTGSPFKYRFASPKKNIKLPSAFSPASTASSTSQSKRYGERLIVRRRKESEIDSCMSS